MRNYISTYILVGLIGLFLFLLQASTLNPIPWVNIPVNYLFVLSFCFASISSITQRLVISLYCGLLIDLWFSSCSFYTISLLIVNSLLAFVSLRTQIDNFLMFISTIIGTMLVELINASFLGFCLYDTPFNPLGIYQHSILKLVIGNSIFALIIFPVIKKRFYVKSTFSRY